MIDKDHIWYALRIAALIAMAALLVTGKAGTQDRHPLAGEAPANQNFTFVHLTDAHIGYFDFDSAGNMKNSVENFTDTLQAVKSINPDFVLITGDNVEYDKRDFFIAFKNLLRSSGVPVKGITPGNHDRRDTLFGLSGNNLSDYNKYIKPISSPAGNNYSFDFGGYRFIGLDSGADYSAVNTSGVTESMITSVSCPPSTCDYTPESNGLSDEQMAELRGELNSTAPKVVFMHHSAMDFDNDSSPEGEIVSPDGGPGGNDGSIAFNRWNFINYTKDSNVQLVLTGHSHRDAIFNINGEPVANNSPDRPLFIQTRSATENGDSGHGYRIVEVKDGKITPFYSNTTPRFERTTAAVQFNSSGWYGLHAYDYQGRHTGMNADCSDIEIGIPDSYYTGDYGGFTSTPQVIVSYSGIKSISISNCMKPPGSENNTRAPQSARADLSITVQTGKSTKR